MEKLDSLWKIQEVISETAETIKPFCAELSELRKNEPDTFGDKELELMQVIGDATYNAFEDITELMFIFAWANFENIQSGGGLIFGRLTEYAHAAFNHPGNEAFYSKENFKRQFNDLLSASHPLQAFS